MQKPAKTSTFGRPTPTSRSRWLQKRLKQVWSLRRSPLTSSMPVITSSRVGLDASCTSRPVTLSGQALSMMQQSKPSLALSAQKLPPVFRTKLNFFHIHSDVLRDAHKVFRADPRSTIPEDLVLRTRGTPFR